MHLEDQRAFINMLLKNTTFTTITDEQSELYKDKDQIYKLLKENDELLAIFTATLNTAKKNLKKTD